MVPIQLAGLSRFRLHVHDKRDRYISAELKRRRAWEPFETRVFLTLLRAGDTFVDLGANLGYYSVSGGLRVGSGGRGFAFEPDPGNFTLLQRNLAENGLTHVLASRCAVSDRAGAAPLYRSPDNLGDHRLFDSGDGRVPVGVSTVSLDGFFRDRARFPDGPGPLHLIKMDTQGCEALILRGAEALLADPVQRPAWLVEYWPFGLVQSGAGPDELLERFAGMDLNLAVLREGEARAVPIEIRELAELTGGGLHPDTGRFLNLVAIPRADPLSWRRVLALGC